MLGENEKGGRQEPWRRDSWRRGFWSTNGCGDGDPRTPERLLNLPVCP